MNKIFRNIFKYIPDKLYLQLMYYKHFHKFMDFKNPKTFNEKLQWLKIYNRNPEYIKMVDKYAVREYIAQKLGEEYLIPLLGVWDDPKDIDFDMLPNQFVLKWNHDSGSVIICKDKSNFDITAAVKKLKTNKSHNGYWYGREWPYKDVSPRVVAEKYMIDTETGELRDYKFSCFNGRTDNVMVCIDRAIGATKFYRFDREWKLVRCNKDGKAAPKDFTLAKPSNMDEMFEMAEKLSEGMPFVRIDFYSVEGKTYFGEITFYPESGFDKGILPETDELWGKMIDVFKI